MARRRIPMSAEAQLSEPASERRPGRFTTSSAAAEDITATITTDLSRPELNPAARDEHVLSPRHTRKNITGSRISGFLESERLGSARRKQRRRKPRAQERRLGFAAQEFGTSSERSANGERESGSHGRDWANHTSWLACLRPMTKALLIIWRSISQVSSSLSDDFSS